MIPRAWKGASSFLAAGLLLAPPTLAAGPPAEPWAGMLAVRTQEGTPVINAAQRAYLDGMNDHLKGLLRGLLTNEVITAPIHLSRLLALKLRPQKMELLLQDRCVLCHTDSEVQTPSALFTLGTSASNTPAHLDLAAFVEGVHFRRGLSCAGCHGGDPRDDFGHDFVKEWPESDRDKSRAWILDFCARCHSDPVFMNRFNPALPTDQLAKFKDSPHGRVLLKQHDQRAPQCISCHGVHGIRGAKNPRSTVYAKNVPATCGSCHARASVMAGFPGPDGSPFPTNQLAEYRRSVHGRALLERGDLGAPACNDCHGNHAAFPVGVSDVSQSCSLCHANNASLFDGSKHKQAFERHHWPQCAQCHGEHAIAPAGDFMLGTGPKSVCVHCHQQYAEQNPRCNATADYFHDTLGQLARALTNGERTAEQLAAKGLDVEPMESQLEQLQDNLRRSRSYIHGFSSNTFAQAAAPGIEAAGTLSRLAERARKQYRIRQTGLLASIALMGLFMLGLYLKLRRLERSPSTHHSPPH